MYDNIFNGVFRLEVKELDVTQDAHIKECAASVKEQYGKLDLLINSAGMLHPSGRGETSLNAVSRQVRVTSCVLNLLI